MKIRDIQLDRIEFNFILSKTELRALLRAIQLTRKKKLTEEEKSLKNDLKELLLNASIREERIFKNIDTIRSNASDGKRAEFMKSYFFTKAIEKALEKDSNVNVTSNKSVKFIRTFYEIERKQFNKKEKRETKYKIGKKTKSLTFQKLYKYLFLINRSKY